MMTSMENLLNATNDKNVYEISLPMESKVSQTKKKLYK